MGEIPPNLCATKGKPNKTELFLLMEHNMIIMNIYIYILDQE